MKLWGGRFTKEENQLVHNFNESLSFDQKFYHQDIQGSIAHVTMLAKQGIVSEEDRKAIIDGLNSILADIESGKLVFTKEHEDIHSFVEANLIERIGDAGKRLHTGRSRNDQVALDMKLYCRDEIDEIDVLVKNLLEELLKIMEANIDTYMPGFTHLQKAQPVTLAHHMGAYFEMFSRDRSRLHDIRKRMNYCPLGSGALAGTTYPLDRAYTAELLGFEGVTQNSLDSVSDRDFAIEFCSCASLIMIHISRMSEELIYWMNTNFAYIMLPDRFTTGSSIMPQKKNPDVPEAARGKSGRVVGHLMGLLMLMKGQPLAYNKDNQEDKEPLFDTIDTVKDTLRAFIEMIPGIQVNKARMREAVMLGYPTATDFADYLVRKGLPFRDAHEAVGCAVRLASEKGCGLHDLTLEELREFSDKVGEDVYDSLTLEGSIASRNHTGGTAPSQVAKQVGIWKERLKNRAHK